MSQGEGQHPDDPQDRKWAFDIDPTLEDMSEQQDQESLRALLLEREAQELRMRDALEQRYKQLTGLRQNATNEEIDDHTMTDYSPEGNINWSDYSPGGNSVWSEFAVGEWKVIAMALLSDIEQSKELFDALGWESSQLDDLTNHMSAELLEEDRVKPLSISTTHLVHQEVAKLGKPELEGRAYVFTSYDMRGEFTGGIVAESAAYNKTPEGDYIDRHPLGSHAANAAEMLALLQLINLIEPSLMVYYDA